MDSQELFGFFGGTGGHLHNLGLVIKERNCLTSGVGLSAGKNKLEECKEIISLLNKINDFELYENSCFMQSIPLVSVDNHILFLKSFLIFPSFLLFNVTV
jgi:hypothetical protein